jgi:hypothetical protein
MANDETTDFTRTCAWTGEEFAGKGIILTTTEGQEIVSEAAFMAPWRAGDQAKLPAGDSGDQAPADPSPEAPAGGGKRR